ncbi:MAG TPA: alpha/beta fold hydrolase [Gammaproteobacteria bacterium]
MAATQQTVQKMTDPKREHFMKKVAEIEVDWPFLDDEASAELNRRLRRGMAQMAGGLSPAMISEAYTEWLTHLAANPGKLGDLAQDAVNKTSELFRYAMTAPFVPGTESPFQPRKGDRRFAADAWQTWPFNVMAQSYLMVENWIDSATQGLPGMEEEHQAVFSFMSSQLLAALSPSNYPLTNPEVLQTIRDEQGQNLVRGAAKALEDVMANIKKTKPPVHEDYIPGQGVAVTEGKVVFRNRLIEVLQYSPQTEKVDAEPILIVPAWIMKYYILDLSPKNSMVKYLVDQGHTVFMISWLNPSEADRDLTMDDYLKLGVMAALDAVTAIVPGQRVHGVGYCIGGTLLSIAAATMARDGDERLKSLTFFAAQADFIEGGEIRMFVNDSQLKALDDLMHMEGYLDSKYMGGSFQALRSNDLVWIPMVEKYYLGKDQFMNDLMSWNADGTRMPYKMHSEYLRKLYLNNDLAEGRFEVDGKPISLADIKIPMFVVGTATDHVAPWVSVYKFHQLAPEAEVTFCLTTGGHNAGIACGPVHPRRAHELQTRAPGAATLPAEQWKEKAEQREGSWWPSWEGWLAERGGAQVKPPRTGNARKGYKPLEDAPGTYVHQH